MNPTPPSDPSPSDPTPREELSRRLVRHDDTRAALRATYGDACQICGRIVRLDPLTSYAEVHVLGSGPEEPEEAPRERCLVLCPEHHALFDTGALAIDPKGPRLWCADDRDPLHGRSLHRTEHALSSEALAEGWEARRRPADDEGAIPLPRHTTPESLLRDMFEAALDPSEEHGFARYLSLVPGGAGLPETARKTLRQFAWTQLRRRARSYVPDGRPESFTVMYTRPDTVDERTREVRVMLAATGRNPAPVVLARSEDGFWWLEFNGL